MHLFQITLPAHEAINRWAAASSTAGAYLPEYVRCSLNQLDWTETGEDSVDPYDITERVIDAVRECQEEHVKNCNGEYFPCPRGLEIDIDVKGNISVVWETENHEIRLTFIAKSIDSDVMVGGFAKHGSGLEYEAVLSCSGPEGSTRIQICKDGVPAKVNVLAVDVVSLNGFNHSPGTILHKCETKAKAIEWIKSQYDRLNKNIVGEPVKANELPDTTIATNENFVRVHTYSLNRTDVYEIVD